ncbi:MAG: 1-phosphofructokinase family hexose kinase [Thermodesulfobacteriota bacterium]
MGEALGRMLADEGLEHYPVAISGEVRESLVVLEAESGREYRLVLPGPELGEEEWRRCLELLAAWAPIPDYLVGSGSLPPGAPEDFWARVARVAARSGARMVLDTSGPALAEALEHGVYLAKPNRAELESLVGSRLEGEEALREASREVVERGGCRVLALSLGSEGALLTWEGGHRRVRAPEVEIRSDVGAGDSFVAGMVLALARERPVEEAFCFGVAAGTAALATPGTELCRKEETEALFRQLCG